MRQVLSIALAVTTLVSACQTPAPSAAKRVPVAAKSVAPKSAGSASPKASPTPAVPVRAVRGVVRIDAHYAIERGAGGLISDNGLGIVSNAGSSVMVVDGHAIPIGAGIVGNNGGGLISDNGLGLVANNGGSLQRRYGTLAAPTVAVGRMLAVKGMGVVALSLLTGQPISVAVLTDADGQFEVRVPESIAQNIRLVAKVPTAKATDALQTDRRFEYNLLVGAKASDRGELNEDTRVANAFLRECGQSTVSFLLNNDELAKDSNFIDTSFTGPMQAVVLQVAQQFRDAIAAAKLTDAQRKALGPRILDAALAYVEIETIEVDTANTIWKGAPAGTKALPALNATLTELREAATKRLSEDPAYFDHKPYLDTANARRRGLGLSAYEIRRPSDFLDFIFDEYIAEGSLRYDAMDAALEDVGLTVKEGDRYVVKSKLAATTKSLFLKVAFVLLTNADAKGAIMDLIAEAGKPTP